MRRRQSLVVCGVLSSLMYVAMNILVPWRDPGYHAFSQTVSELSALGAPTRTLWVLLAIPYTLLVAAFGWGVRASGSRSRPLRIVGSLLIVQGLIGLVWPPMHLRGAPPSLTDSLHIAFAMATVLLMMLALGFGATAFGRRFRVYSVITMVILLGFGALTGAAAPRVAANLPTPWIGVWERITIGAFLLWVVTLGLVVYPDRAEQRAGDRKAS